MSYYVSLDFQVCKYNLDYRAFTLLAFMDKLIWINFLFYILGSHCYKITHLISDLYTLNLVLLKVLRTLSSITVSFILLCEN